MKINNLLKKLNEMYPFETAASWDNVGLLLGDENKNIDDNNIFVSLDVTSEVIEKLPKDSVLITHHPLIFKEIKNIKKSNYEGLLIEKLIKKDITYIALHTNYDDNFLNRYFVEEILEQKVIDESDSLLYFMDNITLDENYFNDLKERLGAETITVVNAQNTIKKVAVCTGSGSSMLRDAKNNGADLLLTGDITYHYAMEAKEIGISLIDLTHFHSEKYFGVDLIKELGAKRIEQSNPLLVK